MEAIHRNLAIDLELAAAPRHGAESTGEAIRTRPRRVPFVDRLLEIADRRRNAAFLLLLTCYVLGFNGQWRIEPDSALYLSLARNLALGRGYVYHGHPHTLAYPGFPLLVAGIFKIFGPDALWPVNLMMLLFALAALGLTYRLFALHAGRPMGVAITLGVGLSKLFFRYSFALMTDMPFLVGVMAFLVGYEALQRPYLPRAKRHALAGDDDSASNGAAEGVAGLTPRRSRWYDWALMGAGLALTVSMRPAMLSFVPVVLLVAVASAMRARKPWRVAGVILLIGLVVAAFFLLDPRRGGGHEVGDYEGDVIGKLREGPAQIWQTVWTDNLPELICRTFVQAMFGQQMGTIMGPILGVVVLVLGVGLFAARKLWGAWVASTIVMMLLVLPHDRYLLAVLPLLVYAWWIAIIWVNHKVGGFWGNVLAMVIFGIGTVMNLSQVIGLIIEQQTPHFLAHYDHGRFPPVIEMSERIHEIVPEGAWVLAPKKLSRVMTYYSDRWVVESNEMPADDLSTKHVYVVIDPTDTESRTWALAYLAAHGLRMLPPPPIVAVNRPAGLPPLKLRECERIQ